ncbi:MAG TPA: hypothetical protein VGL93_17185 [Streptosporangiaceae bacterium]
MTRRPGLAGTGRRAACQAEAGDRMPQAREVTDYLHKRFGELGVQGMTRAHAERLAVLFVCDDLVVWSDGRAVWWMSDGALATYSVPEPDELWRLAYDRYRVISGGSS